jgi:hypothetical protein
MTTTNTQEIQEQLLSVIHKSQQAVLDAIKSWADTVQSVTPKIPNVQVPFAEHLPKPEDVVASAYDFAEALLTGQRKFATDVIKATSALLPGNAAADNAPKTSAPKTSAPKSAAK